MVGFINTGYVCSWIATLTKALSTILSIASPMTLFIIAIIALLIAFIIIAIRNEWEKITTLKAIYVIIAFIIGFALFILFILMYSQILLLQCNIPDVADLSPMDEAKVRNIAIAFIGTISGFGALFGIYLAILKSDENKRQNEIADETNRITKRQNEIANRQSRTAEKQANTAEQQSITELQQSITERLNKAIENLDKKDADGEPVIPMRLGMIYDLERIAQYSVRDHIQIMDMLCFYIRDNSPSNKSRRRVIPREDIQLALTIIGRRGGWANAEKNLKTEAEQRYRMDLQDCDLRGTLLSRANLRGARFLNSNMRRATFDNANLSNASFEDTLLDGAWFGRARMDRAWAYDCDFSKCRALTQKQLNAMFCRFDTKIPKMDGKKQLFPPSHWPKGEIEFYEFQELYWAWEAKQPNSYLASKTKK